MTTSKKKVRVRFAAFPAARLSAITREEQAITWEVRECYPDERLSTLVADSGRRSHHAAAALAERLNSA